MVHGQYSLFRPPDVKHTVYDWRTSPTISRLVKAVRPLKSDGIWVPVMRTGIGDTCTVISKVRLVTGSWVNTSTTSTTGCTASGTLLTVMFDGNVERRSRKRYLRTHAKQARGIQQNARQSMAQHVAWKDNVRAHAMHKRNMSRGKTTYVRTRCMSRSTPWDRTYHGAE